MYLNEINTLD